jgi:hypothetical protein
MKTLFTALLCCAAASSVMAESCARRTLTTSEVTTIDAELNRNVHLVFAEPILRSVIGNEQEWEQFGDPTMPLHLWVLPRSTSPEAAKTSFTVVTAAGAYDFVLRRVPTGGQVCVHFVTNSAIGALSLEPVASANSPISSAPYPLSATQYRWKGDVITRVADDGLYTYITLAETPRSLPTVLGDSAPVTTDYDSSTRTYKIAGLFDELTLVKGRKKIQIKRAS